MDQGNYLSNKNNYINLLRITENQSGGKNNKIFDLSKQYSIFNEDLQSNLMLLEKEYGQNFIIKFDDIDKYILVPAILTKHRIAETNIYYYTLFYDIDRKASIHYAKRNNVLDDFSQKGDHKFDNLKPFKIDFIDISSNELNDTSYINHIRKTYIISGSQMIKLALKINQILGAKKAYIYDGAEITCNGKQYDLSTFKLIENGATFYMKYGFDFDVDYDKCNTNITRVTDKKHLLKRLKKVLNQIRSVKVVDILHDYKKLIDILTDASKHPHKSKTIYDSYMNDSNPENNMDDDFKIIKASYSVSSIIDPKQRILYYKENPRADIKDLMAEATKVISILGKTKQKYLYKYMIELFNDQTKCDDYGVLFDELFATNIYKIVYKNKEITRDYMLSFRTLQNIRHFRYVYTFDDKN